MGLIALMNGTPRAINSHSLLQNHAVNYTNRMHFVMPCDCTIYATELMTLVLPSALVPGPELVTFSGMCLRT